MKIFEAITIKIEYNEEKKQLIQKWNGFSTSEVFRVAIDKTVEASTKYPVYSIISDTLNQSVVRPEDTAYASSVMPMLVQNGLKAMAFVLPTNKFTQMGLKKFDKENKTDVVSFFDSLQEAQEWIDSIVY